MQSRAIGIDAASAQNEPQVSDALPRLGLATEPERGGLTGRQVTAVFVFLVLCALLLTGMAQVVAKP
jgi:hypothetical protein